MPGFLKQSSASQSRAIGPFVDDTDFKTPETALTIANTDVKLIKNGAASVNKNSGGGTHRVNGVYGFTFDATDTDTVGELEVSIAMSGALVVFDKFFVIEEAIYDALFAASANAFSGAAGSTTLTALASGSITAAVVATGAIDADAIADNAIDAGAIAADAITAAKIADGAIDAATFAASAINAAAIATGAITAAKFAAGAIDAAAIATDAIDADAIAASAIDAAAIATGAITAAKFAAGAIDAAAIADAAIDRATFAADTGLQSARSNTAQAGAAGTITLDASASAVTDFYVGMWIYLTGGTGVGQARLCTAYNGTTKVATIAPNWKTNPDATSTFAVLPNAQVDVYSIGTGAIASGSFAAGAIDAAAIQTGAIDADAIADGAIDAGAIATGAITAAKFAAGAIDAAAIATDAIDADAIAANAIDAGAIATGAITAAKFAAGAIDAAALAADAVDEIWDEVVDGTTTARQSLRLANSANGGKLSGAATTTINIRDLADTKNRVTATVDADGNRSAVTTDLT